MAKKFCIHIYLIKLYSGEKGERTRVRLSTNESVVLSESLALKPLQS